MARSGEYPDRAQPVILEVLDLGPFSVDPAQIILSMVHEGEPMGKARPRFNRRTRMVYTPKATAAREQALALLAKGQLRASPPSAFAVGVRVVFHVRARGRADLDNMLKLVLDGLNKIAWRDDRQVCEVMAWKQLHSAQPRTEIAVYALSVV